MNIDYLTQILQNKLTILNGARIQAFTSGDIAQINLIDTETLQIQDTLIKLGLLAGVSVTAQSTGISEAEIITKGIENAMVIAELRKKDLEQASVVDPNLNPEAKPEPEPEPEPLDTEYDGGNSGGGGGGGDDDNVTPVPPAPDVTPAPLPLPDDVQTLDAPQEEIEIKKVKQIKKDIEKIRKNKGQ